MDPRTDVYLVGFLEMLSQAAVFAGVLNEAMPPRPELECLFLYLL